MEILQLSDIHYGTDYKGKFNTKDQFNKVVEHAIKRTPSGYDMVIVSGDLVDVNPNITFKEQKEGMDIILKRACQLCKDGKHGVYVVPGNHDNREALTKSATEILGWSNNPEFMDNGGFNEPGCFMQVVTPSKASHINIVLLDSGGVVPYKGIARLAAKVMQRGSSWNDNDTLLFTHTPFATERLYHRFMKENVMPTDVGELLRPYICHYFCGHYHHLAHVDCGSLEMHLCPGIQCQIDPYSKDCSPTAIPGYQVISLSSHANGSVVVHPVIMDNYEKPSDE